MGYAFAEAKGSKAVTEMAAHRRFGGYGPGQRRRSGKADVKEDAVLTQLMNLFMEPSDLTGGFGQHFPQESIHSYYTRLDKILEEKGISCSTENVREFCIGISGLDRRKPYAAKAGIFISVLVNGGKEEHYDINAEILGRLHYLGYKNRKSLKIVGDVGDSFCAYMESGKIDLHGNTGRYAGTGISGGEVVIHGNVDAFSAKRMDGGALRIKGNAETYLGIGMKGGHIVVEGDAANLLGYYEMDGAYLETVVIEGGTIEVQGNVGMWAGKCMKGGKLIIGGDASYSLGDGIRGGEIHLEGECLKFGKPMGGKIFHRGVLIVDK